MGKLIGALHQLLCFLRRQHICQHHPHLGEEVYLAVGDKALFLLIPVIFLRSLAQFIQLFHQPVGLRPVVFASGQAAGIPEGIDDGCQSGCFLVHAFTPVKERRIGCFLTESAIFGHEAERDLHLLHGDVIQVIQRLFIVGLLHILFKCHRKEQGILKQPGIVCLYIGLGKQAGADPAVRETAAGKQIQAPLYQVIIAEADVVGQGLQTQVAHPEPLIPLRAVLKDILGTVGQGAQADLIHLLKQRICARAGIDLAPVRTRLCADLRMFDDQLVFL